MISLELLLFLAFAFTCLLFSVYFAVMDEHNSQDTLKASVTNWVTYVVGFGVCLLVVEIVQAL